MSETQQEETKLVVRDNKYLDLPLPGSMVKREMVEAIAVRLQKTYTPPKKGEIILPEEFVTVVELALARGYMPLGGGFEYWKYRNEIFVADHYATWVNWAQKLEPFTLVKELDIVEKQYWRCTAIIIKSEVMDRYREAKEEMFRLLVGADIKPLEALQIAKQEARENYAIIGTGQVLWSEVYYDDGNLIKGKTPRGWTPGVTRAEVRSVKNAIRMAYGVPTPGEIHSLMLNETKALEAQAEMPMSIVEAPAEVRDRYLQLTEMADQEPDRKRFLKNVDIMRGPVDDTPIGEEEDIVEGEFHEDKLVEFLEEHKIPSQHHEALILDFFGKDELQFLDPFEIELLQEYAKRICILKSINGDKPADYIAQIPELDPDKTPTAQEAAKVLKRIAKLKYNKREPFEVLDE